MVAVVVDMDHDMVVALGVVHTLFHYVGNPRTVYVDTEVEFGAVVVVVGSEVQVAVSDLRLLCRRLLFSCA